MSKLTKENQLHETGEIGELIVVEHKTLPILFSEGKADSLVDEIEKKVRSFVPDIETTKGRKDIASLAYKIARSKKILDDAGKQLTSDWKAKAKLVDQERSRVWERLENLQDEIRSPLTDYENKEKQRIYDHQINLNLFKDFLNKGATTSNIDDLEQSIIGCDGIFDREWEEYTDQAKDLHEKCILILKEKIANKKIEIEIKKREEVERKLKEEQGQRENEARIAKEAAEKALRIAEEKERLAAEREALMVKAQQEKEVREKQRIELERQEEKERAIKAEKDRLESIERAKAEKLEIEQKAKQDIEEAIKRDREEQDRKQSIKEAIRTKTIGLKVNATISCLECDYMNEDYRAHTDSNSMVWIPPCPECEESKNNLDGET